MAQSLHIGLLERTPGWEIILDGLGLPWRLMHTVGDPTPEEFSLLIVNRHLWSEELDAVESYARAGGALLDVGRWLKARSPWRCRRSYSSRITSIPSLQSSWRPPVIDTGCRTVPYYAREEEGRTSCDHLLYLNELGSGTLAYLGFRPDELLLKTTNRTKRFPGLDRRHPAELVSSVDKGEVIWLVDQVLRHLYRERGLPYARKRRFPGKARSIAAFRIDTDYGTREQIDQLYAISQSSGLPFTWFLHTDGHIGWLDRFGAFESGEIALHCARHRTFRGKEQNLENMGLARDAIYRSGLPEPVGMAAPNGLWNHGLAEAIQQARFLYSSEFSLAFDSLPFTPPLHRSKRINSQFYSALQIPIHPVSAGNLARVRIGDDEMIRYYRRVINEKLVADLPLIFYHHPTHERFGLIEELTAAMLETGAEPMTFAEIALWWRTRYEAEIELSLERDGRLRLHSIERDPSVQIEVDYPEGDRGVIWMDGAYSRDEVMVEEKGENVLLEERPDNLSRLRSFSPTVARRAVRDRLLRMRR